MISIESIPQKISFWPNIFNEEFIFGLHQLVDNEFQITITDYVGTPVYYSPSNSSSELNFANLISSESQNNSLINNQFIVLPIIIEKVTLGYIILEKKVEIISNILQKSESVLKIIIQYVNLQLRNRFLTDEVLNRYRELNLLYRIGISINSCLQVDQLANMILNEALQSIKADSGWIKIIKPQEIFHYVGISAMEKTVPDWLEKQTDTLAIENLSPIIKNRLLIPKKTDEFWKNYQSSISVPITYNSNLLGVFTLLMKKKEFTSNQQKLLLSLSSQIGVTIYNAGVVQELENVKFKLSEKNKNLIQRTSRLKILRRNKNILNERSNFIVNSVRDSFEEMLSTLENLVNIQSGSYNILGLEKVRNYLRDRYIQLGLIEIEVNSAKPHLAFQTSVAVNEPFILLSGHIDTVFPIDTKFLNFERGKLISLGPGVVDMKGGIVVFLYALECLKRMGLLEKIPIRIINECDEEIGSPDASIIYPPLIKNARLAIVAEESGNKGQIVTERRGAAVITINVKGKPAHSGISEIDGINAIDELMYKINLISRINNLEKDVSINIGQINGGMGVNTIAPNASCRLSVRFKTEEDSDKVIERIQEIAENSYIGNTFGQFNLDVYIPPMQRNSQTQTLFEEIKEIGLILGQEILEESRRGASNACHISKLGLPTIDGFGPRGGKDHTNEEYIHNESLIERTALLTLCLLFWGTYS